MKAKKSLGQNFLKVDKYLNLIVDTGDLKKSDLIIEIGPGHGDLTKKILEKGARLLALEKDRELIPILEDKFADYIKNRSLSIVYGDALDIDLKKFTSNKKYKLIANIPFYITGAIIEKFLSSSHKPQKLVLVTQKEVAERIVEKDGKSSILSLSVKLFGIPKIITIIPKGAFVPSPKVDSAIIEINIKNNILPKKEKLFFDLIHSAYAHKRKQMYGNLIQNFPTAKIDNIYKKLNLNPKIRAEDIKIETWVKICDLVSE